MGDVSASMLNGQLTFTAPDGTQVSLTFDKHVEHADKIWSWIGRESGGGTNRTALITFGPDATFGHLPSVNGNLLKLTTVAGQVYVASTPLSQLRAGERPGTDAVTIPGMAAAPSIGEDLPVVAGGATATSTGPTVDVFIAYTKGFRERVGTTSAAQTLVSDIFDTANYALFNTNIGGQYRLVGTMEVDYPDATDNSQALTDLQSGASTSPLAAVHAARDKYGADLVSLVRVFGPAQNGCGLAYIMNSGHDPNYAYSEVSDGQYDEGNGYYSYCVDLSLAHEMGHNLGAAHNVEISPNNGLFAYSHGYRNDAFAFYDIMAYGLGSQTQYAVYSTPLLSSCEGQPCGTAATADVARTLRQTMPIAAAFRASVYTSADTTLQDQLRSAATGRCVDLRGGGIYDNGSIVQMWDCNGSRQQRWDFLSSKWSSYNTVTEMDVRNSQTADGTAVQMWNLTGAVNQDWYFDRMALVTANGKVMDAVGYGIGNGTRLQVWDDLGGTNQRWRYDSSSLQITNGEGRCLDIVNYGTADNTPVQIWDCTKATNQQWYVIDGMIQSGSGVCLQLTGTAVGNGTQVSVGTCTGNPQQVWHLRGEIRSKLDPSICLDDPAAGTANGSYLQVWKCTGSARQQWIY